MSYTITDKITRAIEFATEAHGDQKRKYSGEPYVTHTLEVAEIVSRVDHTEAMIIAAILHDTVEDTDVSFDDITRLFGDDVYVLVEALTDVSHKEDGNRAVRKEIDRLHSAKAPIDAKTIKLADLISNSKSIVAHDKNFARVYLKEKAALLEVLKDGNPELWKIAHNILRESLWRLD